MRRLSFPGIAVEQEERFFGIEPIGPASGGDYYFLSNDVVRHRTWHLGRRGEVAFVGIANPHWFHVLAVVAARHRVRPRRLVAIDANAAQLAHFERLRQLILASRDRVEYLERLFEVRFGARARSLLAGFRHPGRHYVHGGVARDRLLDLERRLWDDAHHDAAAFRERTGLAATPGDRGLAIEARTVGGFDRYTATIACGSRADYDGWPFTAAWGSGFLADDARFACLQAILARTPVYPIRGDAAAVLEPVLMAQRYQPLWLWTSNLLCPWFVERHPPLAALRERIRELGSRRRLPELDLLLLQDARTRPWLGPRVTDWGVHRRPWSVHTRSFHDVARHLRGTDCLEVVNVPRWIEEDGGTSKLPNTAYCTADDLEAPGPQPRRDSILLHVLLGHGMDRARFDALVARARALTDNLIILEHNAESRDFRGRGIGLSVRDLVEAHGPPDALSFVPGERSRDRNFVGIYAR